MPHLSFNIDLVVAGKTRLTNAQALELHNNASLHDLGQWASAVTQRMHPQDTRTYVIDRNINYTNVCTAKCTFCAFRRDHEDADSYTLSYETIGEKIRELVSIGGTQILMQGGMNDALPIEWYEELLRYIRSNFPGVHIHAFSPPEFVEFERFFKMDVRDIIRRFKAAGLATIPGGGGEIFAPRVRRRIGIGKCTGDDWLRVMRVAHEEGMNTSATMLIGHIEFVRERIEHMAPCATCRTTLCLSRRTKLTKNAPVACLMSTSTPSKRAGRGCSPNPRSVLSPQHLIPAITPLSSIGPSSAKIPRSAALRNGTQRSSVPSTTVRTKTS